jgi:hypothetical protein
MERMRVQVRSVRALPNERLGFARVSATSTRKVRGRPVARIELKVAVEVQRDEPDATLRSRVRDEALAFLDVS